MSSQHTLPVYGEYMAIEHGCGWVDHRGRGCLRVDGPDAVRFLHALVSHDVETLVSGGGVYATWLTPQGRLITDLHIYHCGDFLLADVAGSESSALARRLDQLIFAEDVRVTDVTESIARIVVLGERAAAQVVRALGLSEAALGVLAIGSHVSSGATIVVKGDVVDLPNFEIFVPSALRTVTVEKLGEAGIAPISPELLDALRIEAGRPLFGRDMTEETIPLEAGLLDRAISQTKGCYVGQEVIVRVLHRGSGRVAKRLVKLDVDAKWPAALPPAGAVLATGGRDVGRVTSAAWSPQTGRIVALGYVHRDEAEPGRAVEVRADPESLTARVVGLAG